MASVFEIKTIKALFVPSAELYALAEYVPLAHDSGKKWRDFIDKYKGIDIKTSSVKNVYMVLGEDDRLMELKYDLERNRKYG